MNETYEMVLTRFENLIKKLIKDYGLSSDFDEMQQIGRIALWEAYTKYDPVKGHFPPYAKQYISGRLLQAAKKSAQHQHVVCSEAILQTTHHYEVQYLEELLLQEYVNGLSKRERLFVECVILQGEPQTVLAEKEGVSYQTVRSWRKTALAKLRIIAGKMNHPKV
ncbi:sigma-70 family RNA polymerase sigma factor [Alkalihalobacillus sp. AL-G]|uniref:sigma-70 family RNA polymerase sigma factor n=1 Tax=Alkalihalobacillus sp. AL-G TaxID=2926399 RepID=UPI00272CE74F|nr:sigma-70 family RNA polymerase sigma factor [Alkalihalobacillus sp. AL-G]WLD94874.1 sigma-70 family RNA polymerase sigma factor [Alkalihalobacillus sp. AL-G]